MNTADNDNRAVGEVINTRTATLWIGVDGIGRIIRDSGAEENLSDAKEILEAGRKLLKSGRIPCISDIRGAKSIAREAREFYAGEEAANLASANALLVDSPLSRVLGNFHIFVDRPIYPVRLFTSEPKALEWLKGFL